MTERKRRFTNQETMFSLTPSDVCQHLAPDVLYSKTGNIHFKSGNIYSKSWNITFIEVLINVTSAGLTQSSTGIVSKDLQVRKLKTCR